MQDAIAGRWIADVGEEGERVGEGVSGVGEGGDKGGEFVGFAGAREVEEIVVLVFCEEGRASSDSGGGGDGDCGGHLRKLGSGFVEERGEEERKCRWVWKMDRSGIERRAERVRVLLREKLSIDAAIRLLWSGTNSGACGNLSFRRSTLRQIK